MTPPSRVIAASAAKELWKTYGFSSPRDLVLEDLAFAMGVVVIEGRLDGADARLLRKADRGLIRLRQDIPEAGRKRFAIAHELGHWVMHRRVTQMLACTSEDMVSKYKASPPEIEANYFASELLMPSELFKARVAHRSPSLDLLKALADDFGTTLTASAIRYVEVVDDYAAIVVSEKGKIRWFRASESFEKRFWLEPGTALPRKSVGAALFRGEFVAGKPEILDVDTWLDPNEFETGTIVEQAFLLGRYNQIISLLWLP